MSFCLRLLIKWRCFGGSEEHVKSAVIASAVLCPEHFRFFIELGKKDKV